MSVNIPNAPNAKQAKEDLARLAELRTKSAPRVRAANGVKKRIVYVGLGVLLASNIVLGALLVSGIVGSGTQAQPDVVEPAGACEWRP